VHTVENGSILLKFYLHILFSLFVITRVDAGLQEQLQRSVEALSSYESRLTGYAGTEAAATWIEGELRQLGIGEIHSHDFELLMPIDEGFVVEAAGETLRLYGVWPNLVRTSTLPAEGIAGELLYAGDGSLLQGNAVAGRIVLLDYESGPSWVEAFHLGAQAVIFLQTDGAHRKEAEQKFLAVPADLPRFFANRAEAVVLRDLAEKAVRAHVRGRMPMREVGARNIVAIVEGSDPTLKEEAVYITAYYDAMSPVPALAPGAEQAASAAALLELARQWAVRPPRRTVVLVWAAGHFENLAGMRYLAPVIMAAAGRREMSDIAAKDRPLAERLAQFKLRFVAGLDLSSGSRFVGAFRPAAPYRTSLLSPPITGRLIALAAAYEDSALAGERVLANGLKQDFSRQGLGSMAQVTPVDASVLALAGCPALSFATINDSRARFDVVDDISANVRFDWLGEQVELLTYLLANLVDDGQLEAWEWGNDAFGTIRGQVVHYGPRSYLPDVPTAHALVRVRLRHPTLAGVRPDFWAAADDSGYFAIPGVETRIIYTQPVRLEAYGLDADGAITDAPDWGINGERKLPGRSLKVQMDDLEENVQIVTAQMRGTAIFGIFDPRNLLTPETLSVIDADFDAEPMVFGACLPLTAPEMELFGYKNYIGSWTETVAVIFARSGTRFKAVMSTGRYGLGRRLLLLNSSEGNALGKGYLIEGEGSLVNTVYQASRDMYLLNDSRIANLEKHGVRNGRLASFHVRAGEHLKEAEAAGLRNDHRAYLDQARRAWAYAAAAYRDIESTQAGVVKGALFLLAIFIPFAHFAERLVFGFPDMRRQVLGYFAIFFVGFLALSKLHPAFELSISPFVILLGFIILVLGLLVTAIGISRLNRELQEMARGRRGQVAMQRGGAAMASISVGLAHMRRRPLRTGMTCATLVLLTFSVLSFTSIRSSLRTNWIDVGAEAAYDGLLVRMLGWKPMEMEAYRMLVDRYGRDVVAPRAWKSVSSAASTYRVERVDIEGRSAGVMGFSGLSAVEARLVRPQEGLAVGRWLKEGESDVCLLPVTLADSLGITALDVSEQRARVRLFGEEFRVIGLLQHAALERADLNGEALTPLDPEAQKPTEASNHQGGQPQHYAHMQGAATIVLPFSALMRWEGAHLVSLAVLLDGGAGRESLESLSEVLDLNLFAGIGGRRYLINTVGVASVSGLGELVIPLGIAALIVLNTMLGAVYERTREIGTLNAIGLAPSHVSALFIAEAVALAIIGAVMGYLLGQTAAQVMGSLGWLQGLELNYSSLSAIVTVGLVILLVVASALYPAHMAGKICTPGIERRWKPPTPVGDDLQMRLPFTLARMEAEGMAAFQAEFWGSHREQSIGAGFYVEELRVGREGNGLRLYARVWLAPFDQGVVQETALTIEPGENPAYCDIDVHLHLVTGDWDTWQRVARTFLDDLRKQFLVWRTLSDEDRHFYSGELAQWENEDAKVGI
jgi:hypothetical protein